MAVRHRQIFTLRSVTVSPARPIPTSPNMPATRPASSPNCLGTSEPEIWWLNSVLGKARVGCYIVFDRPRDGLWAPTDPAKQAERMHQVIDSAKVERQASVERSSTPLTPPPRLVLSRAEGATHARSRGIRFPISLYRRGPWRPERSFVLMSHGDRDSLRKCKGKGDP